MKILNKYDNSDSQHFLYIYVMETAKEAKTVAAKLNLAVVSKINRLGNLKAENNEIHFNSPRRSAELEQFWIDETRKLIEAL